MKSQAMIKQIKELHSSGHGIRKIAQALGVARNTVKRHLKNEMSPENRSIKGESKKKTWASSFDWETVLGEARAGVTVLQLHKEYEPPVSYKQFCRLIHERRREKPKPACRIQHTPGEKTFIDFTDGIPITCPRTGKRSKTHLFIAVLPFSSKTFGVFVEDQSLPNFIRCHEKMWAYFGGVTPYVVIDNLKAGVKKAHIYDPDKNPTYCDYGNQTGFAVLPARPYTPRDKASVETGAGVVQKGFYQQVRNETFYSISQLNERWFVYLNVLNDTEMKDYGVSRNDRFANEKELLLPLRQGSYEIASWKTPKVHPDCCVQIDKSFYSVPFSYCGQRVRAKVTDKLIAIYSEETEHIVTHSRATRIGTVCIRDDHLPPWSLQSSRIEVKRCQELARAIGPRTEALFEQWFSSTRPLTYLRRAQGVCRLQREGLTVEAIEYGSSQALTFERHRLAYIRDCARAFSARPKLCPSSLPTREDSTIHLHGRNF